MEVSALANETLLAVFGFLTPEDLLQCRAVCHRWASLAQDPTLWCGLNVDTKNCKPKLLSAILRFAPCLGLLKVNYLEDPMGPLRSTLVSTACAVSGLDFFLRTADAVYAALVISRHASLGRLKVVRLIVTEAGSPNSLHGKHSVCGLLIQMSHIQGLEKMDLNADVCFMDRAVAEFAKHVELDPATAPVSPSLKQLVLPSFDFFGQLLLQWHADTLEEVGAHERSANSAQVALLLSRLPRLRKLSCPPLESMETLLQCPSLKELHLHVSRIRDSADESCLLEACAYLRVAVSTQLQHFMVCPKPGTQDSVFKLLTCFKEGTTVALRSVRLDLFGLGPCDDLEEDIPYQQPLVLVLHRLSLLTLLDLDSMPTPALLQALDGRAVPQLTQLVVAETSEDCEHQFIHSEAVRTLLRNYPRLHVIIKFAQFCDGCACAFCKEGCHAVPDEAWCMLFGHEAGARCDVPHESYFYEEAYYDCVAFHVSTN